VILVSVTHSELAYRRYDGRVQTHELVFEQPLDKHWTEVLRKTPGELASISCLRGKYVRRRSYIPTPPIVTIGTEFT
jgi:hypothetical protein